MTRLIAAMPAVRSRSASALSLMTLAAGFGAVSLGVHLLLDYVVPSLP